MKGFSIIWILLVVLATPANEPTSNRMSIFYQGSVNGEIEPCGCPTVPKGGVARKAAMIAEVRAKQPVVVLDAGDLLFPDEAIGPEQAEQRRIKAELILASNQIMKVDALGLGDQDLAFGVSFLKEMQAKYDSPFLSANLLDKTTHQPVFAPHKIITAQGAKIGVFSIMGVHDWRGKPIELGQQWELAAAEKIAAEQIAALKKERVDYIVALTSQGLDADKQLAENVRGIDLIIGSHSNTTTAEPVHVGKTLVVHAGERGEDLGQLEFTLAGEARTQLREAVDTTANFDVFGDETSTTKKRTEVFNDVIPLAPDTLDHPGVAKLVADAKKSMAALATAVPDVKLTGPFIGAQACKGCHLPEYNDWVTTPHAKAYATLIEYQRQYDYDCVGCHTTAYRRDGGFTNPWAVGDLKNVQCEVCHGGGKQHALAPKKNKLTKMPAAPTCVQCHSKEQTGDRFDFETYVPKVSHEDQPPG